MCSLEFENHRPLYNWVIENIFGTAFPKPVSYTHLDVYKRQDYYRRQGIDPEPIVGKLEEDCDHCESCGN